MFCLLKLIVIPVLLGYSWGFVSSPELRVHVGDSTLMGCVVQSTEKKPVSKVDWILSPEEHAENEYVLYYYSNLSVPLGRFQNRACLVEDNLHNDGSLLLQNVQEADQGVYTCEVRFERESMVFKKSVVLHVLPEEPKELTILVGDSTQMGCFFQSTEERRVTKVEWMFSSGEHAKEEIILRSDFRFNMHRGYTQNQGQFRNRIILMGDISHYDGSMMLQGVKESDEGIYTCRIYLGKLVFKKTIMLHVIQKESQISIPTTPRPEILDGNQLVIIVGIVCATVLLLPVLILIVKRTHWNKSSTAMVKSLENTKKANAEKHVYSSITTREVMEEEPRGQSEGTYMTMHPVRPSLRSDPNNAVEKRSDWRHPQTEPTF